MTATPRDDGHLGEENEGIAFLERVFSKSTHITFDPDRVVHGPWLRGTLEAEMRCLAKQYQEADAEPGARGERGE